MVFIRPDDIHYYDYFKSFDFEFIAIFPWLIYIINQYALKDKRRLDVPYWFMTLIEQMSEPENFIIGLDKMLEIANYSHGHVARVFQKYIGKTPTEFINEKRMEYAAKLLQQNRYDVVEICYMSGCNNLGHFYSLFKKAYGCSPKEFLK